MKLSHEDAKRLSKQFQAKTNCHIDVTQHFMERLFDRVTDVDQLKRIASKVLNVLKNDTCVLVFRSVLTGNSIRVAIDEYTMVCYFSIESKKLILKTIY